MKINRVYIKSFGGIADREYVLSDGLNIIFGENESGKTTFLSFIRFVFYGAKKSRGKELSFRDKYMPWSGADMSGEIEFMSDGISYSLSRTVSASGRKKDVTYINKTTGDTVSVKDDEIGLKLFGLSEEAFLKTLFLGAEGSMISSDGELLAKISNAAQSGDDGISYQSISGELNEMIAELIAPRRAKAVIPSIEKRIELLNAEKTEAERLYQLKSTADERLNIVKSNLKAAENKKKDLADNLKKSEQYDDYCSYIQSRKKLAEAEEAYKSAIDKDSSGSDKYSFIKNITPQEEQLILKDNTADISAAKMQAVLLADKSKTLKALSVTFGIASVLCILCAIFSPIVFVAAAAFAALCIFFILSYKKKLKSIEELNSGIENIEKEKNAVLNKYNLENTEHYKLIRREASDEAARAELKNEKLAMAKKIYEERMAEHEGLLKLLTEKHGNIDGLECSKPDIDSNLISSQLSSIDSDILRYTAEAAALTKEAEASEGIAQKLSELNNEISDLLSARSEAEDKLRILQLADELLKESYEELKSNFAPRLAKSTAAIFNQLTGGKYGELIVNDEFEIQIKKDGKYENSKFFSSGTIQQLYFSLRLGIIELIMGNFPLFIDDAFITYDDARFEGSTDFLRNYSENNQIIFCTCHARESGMDGANVLKF